MRDTTNGMNNSEYCLLENDGIALCVCKHKPCEKIARLEQENLDYIRLYNEEVKKNKELEQKLKRLQA